MSEVFSTCGPDFSSARIAVPVTFGRSGRGLVHEGAPAGEANAGADTGRSQPRPAMAARHTAARAAQGRPADIRIGYARCSALTQELQAQRHPE
ncbi:hypothetical protein [Nonomuraea sp. NPDC049141]|uniref:hypothetical protein n=1 Tax=Nonomuraea sp. NPDC049141 TaxID=3155500 RepID=UPI0033C9EDFA